MPGRGLYAITDEGTRGARPLAAAVAAVIRGGAVMIQYRAKANASPQEARALREVCVAQGVPLIVNDDPQLARACDAAGVHLGRDDAGIETARRLLGDAAIIGVSCYNELDRALVAEAAGADYVAFGRFFPSGTKPTAVQAAPALLTEARRRLRLPIVAIGGITPDNGAPLLAAGADLLAVIEGVFGQPDPESAARRYAQLFHQGSQR